MTGLALPVLILAAGMSNRMAGRDKLMEEVDGTPLLLDRVAAARATGQPVLVTLPPRDARPERWNLLDDLPVAAIEVPDAEDGMARSLAAGITALPEGAVAVMILLADMPEITTEDMRRVLDAFDGDMILRGATADGKLGHPVVFPFRDFTALRSLEGDSGAQVVLDENADRVRAVSLPYSHARTDLDTPEAWDAWRAGRES
ncbi:nucleotidyltransferase family protein [Maritimibacter sp. UBA3975]|uniref:nucleotidyltransferase family protein n=1 Tax=Maritimibacter sp. UBA3975 TaxID=1946833 RepID=UPI000C096ECC|nr:nucleotidyltransferase family protein [Maritimibacter sp. UBA3975]MAM60637.1 4-diphosphocytidyl-2C-methyl-D-erythritol synthase [Maritimibacter sp.]|tara:strand:- start:1197 stop:1802 length:606 start_codon:yes stop_codon:yes gene_type:complete